MYVEKYSETQLSECNKLENVGRLELVAFSSLPIDMRNSRTNSLIRPFNTGTYWVAYKIVKHKNGVLLVLSREHRGIHRGWDTLIGVSTHLHTNHNTQQYFRQCPSISLDQHRFIVPSPTTSSIHRVKQVLSSFQSNCSRRVLYYRQAHNTTPFR